MLRDEPWQRAEIPGPIKAILISDPKRLARLIKAFKRPLLVVGSRISNFRENELIDCLIELAKVTRAHIAATGKHIKKFREKGFRDSYFIPAIELLNRLSDPNWKGFDNGGRYDLVIFVGFHYYYEWLLLSSLKHFAYKWLRTLTLGPYFQPHATWSPPNMHFDEWFKFLEELKNCLR